MIPVTLQKALFIAAALVPGLAFAHAALVKSVPGSRASLTEPPKTLELCFNEAVELQFSTVKLLDPGGGEVPMGELALGVDPKCIGAQLPALEPGKYTVRYKVLSRDGHIVEYGYQFTLGSVP